MAYNLDEQEQIAEIKAWWKQYGNYILWTVIVALAAYSAWMLWNNYQRKQATQASHLYYEMQGAVVANDNERVQRIAKDTQEKFGGTAYASMNSLVAARFAYDQKDIEASKAQLKWVAENGKNDGYKAVARIRLAGVLLDEKLFDEALKTLSAPFPESFVSMAEDRKGDILAAQNKKDEARVAYQKAIEKASPDDPGKQMIQLKLEEIGVAPVATK